MKMPSKEQILKASKDCPDAKEVLKKLFPEAFKEEWEDITGMVTPEIVFASGNRPYLRFVDPETDSSGSGFANSAATGYASSIAVPLFIYHPDNYKIEKRGDDSFRILKRRGK